MANDFGTIDANLLKTVRKSGFGKLSFKKPESAVGIIKTDIDDFTNEPGFLRASPVDIRVRIFRFETEHPRNKHLTKLTVHRASVT